MDIGAPAARRRVRRVRPAVRAPRLRWAAAGGAVVLVLAVTAGDRAEPDTSRAALRGDTPASTTGEVGRRGAGGFPGSAPGDRAALAAGPERALPEPPPPASFTLVATGDVLLHSPLWRQAEADAAAAGHPGRDFAPLLAGVRPLVEGADLAICHMETPLAPPEGPFSGYPVFSVPPEIVPALKATGYDACSTASNHTYDKGGAGIDRTLADLDAGGLAHAGSARSPQEASHITMLRAGEARVALLSYAFGFNGIPAPDGQTWRSNLIDENRILADAARARAGGADVVVVALHWGTEYQQEPSAQQADLAPRLIRSPDIDLLLGHHAHVVEPVQNIGGEWVVYGMGNLVATHSTPGAANHEGLLVRFTFTDSPDGWHVTKAEYAPLLMVTDHGPMRVVDVDAALAGGDPALRGRLEVARDRTNGVVGSRGALAAGLRPIAA